MKKIEAGLQINHSPGFSSQGTLCRGFNQGDDIDSSNITCPACLAKIKAAHDRLVAA